MAGVPVEDMGLAEEAMAKERLVVELPISCFFALNYFF
jgi:hypothetical protein